MSVHIRLIEARDLKGTQTIGKQDPYATAALAVDLSPICGVSADTNTAMERIPDAKGLRLMADTWKSVVVEDGGLAPKWPEGEGSEHKFQYVPGVDTLVVTVMNKNMGSDTFIGEACISLHTVFQSGETAMWFPLKRNSGRHQGDIFVNIAWVQPEVSPIRIMVPLTFELNGTSASYTLARQTVGDVRLSASKKAEAQEILAHVKAAMPRIIEFFGEDAYPILQLGGAPVESVEPAVAQCGLKEHDIIVGYAADHKATDGGRGLLALKMGNISWGRLVGETREQALKELRQFDSKGSVTLTVLRAMPLRAIPDGHPLKVAFVTPPASFRYEPTALSCIGNQPLAPLHPDVRPAQGRPFTFQAVNPLPAGLELTHEGVLTGTPTEVGKHVVKIVASNRKGSQNTDVSIHVMTAPTELQYTLGHRLAYALGQPIASNTVARIDGDGPFKFYCEPPLPQGLNIDPESGAISGTPMETCQDAMSVVTATSPAGSVDASLIVSVLAPPASLAYSTNTIIAPRGPPIADMHVTFLEGSPPFRFEASPPLPNGLTVDPSTGSVTGSPTCQSAQAEYKIRVSNVAGCAEFAVSVAVLEKPSGLEYQHGGRGSKLSYSVGCEIIENRVVSLIGTVPMRFTCTPELPAGLKVDEGSGLISGTPEGEVEASMFEITAANDVGSTTCQLILEVAKQEDTSAESVFNPEAVEVNQPIEQLQGPGGEVKAFLERVGVPDKYDLFVQDGWDSLDMIYAMSKLDLKDVGLTEDEADRVLAGQPSADRAQDRRNMKRFMADKGFSDLEPMLISKGIKGLRKLATLSLKDLLSLGLPQPRAQALAQAIQSLSGGPTAPVAPPAPELLNPQVAQAGVGLTVSQMHRGTWFVTDIIHGGAAFMSQTLQRGDMLQAVTSDNSNGVPVKITPATTLDDIRRLILGPVGTYVTLMIMRKGTRFEVPLLRAPVAKQAPAQKNEAEVTLTVRVKTATNLPAMDRGGTSDPYVLIACNGQAYKTPVIWKTLNPTWNADFIMRVGPSTRLVLSVWDKDTFDPDDLIGKVHVAISDVVNFSDGTIKMSVIKARLVAPDGGNAHGPDGNNSHIYLEFPSLKR